MLSHKIQIITLDPQADYVQALLSSLCSEEFTTEPFSAVDGRQDFPSLIEGEVLDQETAIRQRLIPLTKTEVACYLSHLRAIRQAYNSGVEKLCLLEDDISVEDNFSAVLTKVFALPDEFEFVRLMGIKRHKYKVIGSLDDSTALVRPVKGLCGTQGYVINRSGMLTVLNHGSTIREPIDKFYDHFWECGLKSYAVIPHIIWERPSSSSIAKKSRREAAKGIKLKLKRHWLKVKRSAHRQLYLLRHWKAFRPAVKPAKYLGKTARIH